MILHAILGGAILLLVPQNSTRPKQHPFVQQMRVSLIPGYERTPDTAFANRPPSIMKEPNQDFPISPQPSPAALPSSDSTKQVAQKALHLRRTEQKTSTQSNSKIMPAKEAVRKSISDNGLSKSKTEPLREAPPNVQGTRGEEQLPATREAVKVDNPSPLIPSYKGRPLLDAPLFDGSPRPPQYPEQSIDRNEQGMVMLRVLIDPSGSPEELEIWKSSGFPALDKAAISAVRNWRFVPARMNGQAVAAWAQVPVNFLLN